jgi:hypothetical protein
MDFGGPPPLKFDPMAMYEQRNLRRLENSALLVSKRGAEEHWNLARKQFQI